MQFFTRLYRLIYIQFIIIRYNLDEMILGMPSFYWWRFLIVCNPYYWLLRRRLTRGERLRCALEALGPIFIKVGQILSTRFDWLPEDIVVELAKLQDHVPPFPGEVAKRLIEKTLSCRFEMIFASFEMKALASASIAQVHAATLQEGQEVVVKVLRPQIQSIVDQDISLLKTLAALMERYATSFQQFKPKQVVFEIAQTLYTELDLLAEGANATQLRRNFASSHQLAIPKIYWSYSCQTVLVMERMYGVPIHQVTTLAAAGVSMPLLAERGITLFFTQIFRDSFFHADLHPGNIFIDITQKEDPKYILVDFGIMGALSPADQRYIAENMVAFFKRDYYRVAELHVKCGWLPIQTNLNQFAGAIRTVCEPIFSRPLADISFGQLLLRLFQVARRFNINIQPQLILLQKTLLNIESLSRQLAPSLDLWKIVTPEIEKWLKKQVGLRALLTTMRNGFPAFSEQCVQLPTLVYDWLQETKRQQMTAIIDDKKAKQAELTLSSVAKWRYFLSGILLTLCSVMLVNYFLFLKPITTQRLSQELLSIS